MKFDFDRIKIPTGGNLAFQIPTGGEEPEVRTSLVCVLLDHYAANAYWSKRFGQGEKRAPDCSSLDGKTGTALAEATYYDGRPLEWAGASRSCKGCPLNEYGTGLREDGTPSRGKACKNMHRVFPLFLDEHLPYMISLPPSSLGSIREYMKQLVKKGRLYYSVVTKIRLVKDKSHDGIEFSKTAFSRVEDLPPQHVAALKQFIAQIRPAMRAVEIEDEDYAVETETAGQADDSEPF